MVIEFTAEIKKVSSKTLASLDLEYRCELASNELALYELGALPAGTLINVKVEVMG